MTGRPQMGRPRESGVALVEVLVALVIFAALLVVMNRSVAVGLAGLSAAEREAEAVAVAQSVLAEAGLTFPLVTGDTRRGAFGAFAWDAEIDAYRAPGVDAAVATDPGPPKAFRIAVGVTWKEPRTGKARRLALRSIKLAGEP